MQCKSQVERTTWPDANGYYGDFGGRFVPETLVTPLLELEEALHQASRSSSFTSELESLLSTYAGRPTPLFHSARFSEMAGGGKLYLKREDLLHTGAHKINNTLGQALLAKFMGKQKVIAETGAGQHGVATAAAAALLGLECRIFMGEEDMRRQAPNVFRMNLMGAEVTPVSAGTATLKDAMSEAMRHWATHIKDTFYVIGSVAGPHPYPMMVARFQAVIGQETRSRILEIEGKLPSKVIACVGGGQQRCGNIPWISRRRGCCTPGRGSRGARHRDGQTRSHLVRRAAGGIPRLEIVCPSGRRRPGSRSPFHFRRS